MKNLLCALTLTLWCMTPCSAGNVALNRPASANATYSGSSPANAVDGNTATAWTAPAHGTPSSPYWLKIDFESVVPVYRVTVRGPSSPYVGYTLVYQIHGSTNDADWSLLGGGTLVDTTDPIDMHYPGGADVRFIRYTVLGGSHWAQLAEMVVNPVTSFTDISVSNSTVSLSLTNCLPDVTNVVERAFALEGSNIWVTVTNITSLTDSTIWNETVVDKSNHFYRIRMLEGQSP